MDLSGRSEQRDPWETYSGQYTRSYEYDRDDGPAALPPVVNFGGPVRHLLLRNLDREGFWEPL
jgi:hypothetical protein